MTTGTRLPLLLALLSGCFLIPVEEEADDSRAGFHDVTVSWHLRNIDGSVMTACPAGFSTLALHFYRAGYVEPPDALVILPCTPEGTHTQPVATSGKFWVGSEEDGTRGYYDYEGRKDIWVDVTEDTQTRFAGVSYTYYVDPLSADLTLDFDIFPKGGVGVGAWSLRSGLTTASLKDCAAAGVDTIEVGVRPYADETAPLVVGGTWPCEGYDPYFYYNPDGNSVLIDSELDRGSGRTRAFAAGDYFVEWRAKRGGAVVGTSDGSFLVEEGNSFHVIRGSDITIDDR